jgi:hypothetical protein
MSGTKRHHAGAPTYCRLRSLGLRKPATCTWLLGGKNCLRCEGGRCLRRFYAGGACGAGHLEPRPCYRRAKRRKQRLPGRRWRLARRVRALEQQRRDCRRPSAKAKFPSSQTMTGMSCHREGFLGFACERVPFMLIGGMSRCFRSQGKAEGRGAFGAERSRSPAQPRGRRPRAPSDRSSAPHLIG